MPRCGVVFAGPAGSEGGADRPDGRILDAGGSVEIAPAVDAPCRTDGIAVFDDGREFHLPDHDAWAFKGIVQKEEQKWRKCQASHCINTPSSRLVVET
jgi:hypothetical protein